MNVMPERFSIRDEKYLFIQSIEYVFIYMRHPVYFLCLKTCLKEIEGNYVQSNLFSTFVQTNHSCMSISLVHIYL